MLKESFERYDIVGEGEKSSDEGGENKHRVQNAKLSSMTAWLNSDQLNQASLARQIWPDMDEDTARSLFSKKVRGHDAEGKPYSFTESELNTLYNIKNSFVKKIDKKLNEGRLKNTIAQSIKRVLKEGTVNPDLMDRWYNLAQSLGADEMLNAIMQALPSDEIESMVEFLERNYEVSMNNEDEI